MVQLSMVFGFGPEWWILLTARLGANYLGGVMTKDWIANYAVWRDLNWCCDLLCVPYHLHRGVKVMLVTLHRLWPGGALYLLSTFL